MGDEKSAVNRKPASGSGMKVDSALVRELAELLGETGLTEIEVEDGDRKIRVSRAGGVASFAAAAPAAPMPAPVAATAADTAAPAVSPDAVKSPMVGTAYLAAEPGAPDFVAVGKEVRAGETLLIVEAMKVMNAIPSPRSGKVTAILIANGEPVEFDQPLIVIE